MCYSAFPWAERACSAGVPAALPSSRRPGGTGPSAAPDPLHHRLPGWFLVGVGGGGGGENTAVSPPSKAQAFSWVRAVFHRPRSEEQRQKAQILLSGGSGCLCCISGPYVNLHQFSSRTYPTQPVTPNSSLDSGDAGAELSWLHRAWL